MRKFGLTVDLIKDNIEDIATAMMKDMGNTKDPSHGVVLLNTGRLRESAYVVKSGPSSASIIYSIPSSKYPTNYASDAFNNSRIKNPTTPGTSSFWVDEYINALMTGRTDRHLQDAISQLNSKVRGVKFEFRR